MIKEAFKLTDALLKNDSKNICEELGDVMEHVIFCSMLGEGKGDFDVANICDARFDKPMFRHDFVDWTDWNVAHPDMVIGTAGQVVYEDGEYRADNNVQPSVPSTASQVESTREQCERRERGGNASVLSSMPNSLPSLIKTYYTQGKVCSIDFGWEEKEQIWDKAYEELGKLKDEMTGRSR